VASKKDASIHAFGRREYMGSVLFYVNVPKSRVDSAGI